jgi:Leucine-rich repeat (LRR) protein
MTKKIIGLTVFIFVQLIIGCSNSGEDGDGVFGIVNTDPNCNQIVNIPDANFKAKLLSGGYNVVRTLDGGTILDANGDGQIQVCEAENIGSLNVDQSDINSIEGILQFRNIQNLSFKYNNVSQPLDFTSLKRLSFLAATNNDIPSLNVTGLSKLEYLTCDDNKLQALNVASLKSLKTLYCELNQISNLNIQGSNKLEDLRIYHNKITELNVSSHANLKSLYTSDNLLTELNVSGLTNLLTLNCSSNQLLSLNATNCKNLFDIICNQNNIQELKISGCETLINLQCYLNKITSINLTGLTNLGFFNASGNKFVSVDIRDCPNMNYLDVSFNPNLQTLVLKNGTVAIQGINIYLCPSLSTICCDAIEQTEISANVQTYNYNCAVITNCF